MYIFSHTEVMQLDFFISSSYGHDSFISKIIIQEIFVVKFQFGRPYQVKLHLVKLNVLRAFCVFPSHNDDAS